MSRLPDIRHTDPAVFGRVAVLLGGSSSEREVSLDSGRNVLDALRARGVAAQPIDGIPALLTAIGAGTVDRVFNILHGGDGENGVVQGLLAALKVPFTGPGVLGAALTLDKVRSKQVWSAAGLPTPGFVRVAVGGDLRTAARTLGLPVFIKPSNEGSSVGVFRVTSEAELEPAIEFARHYQGDLLIEQMVQGDEYTVGILGELALPSIRIVPAGAWYDYHAKYVAEDTQYLCPGMQGEDEEREIGRLALAAFQATGCSGWGRVDLMRDRVRGLQLIEVNTAPGMTSHSLVPKAAAALGIDFATLCWHILEQTLPEVRAR